MMPCNVYQLETAAALANRRSLLMRLALPVLLSLPFVMVAMPPRAKAAGLVVLLLFVAFFGAAVTMVRRRAEGHLARLSLLPIPGGVVMLDYVLAGAAIDLLQVATVIGLYVIVNATGAITIGSMLVLAGLTCAAVVLLNVLGMLLAAAVKSNQEVHLIGALAVGLIATVSGLAPVPARIAPLVNAIAVWNPVAHLAGALSAVASGGDVAASGAVVVAACAALVATVAAMTARACLPR